jgi:predicted Fe-S protein YdhL (DUF1289 family)
MEDPVRSPCNNVCRMDPVTGLCEGCLRSLDEIARWAQTTNDDRRQILAWVEKRKEEGIDPWSGALRGDCD